MSRPRPPSSLPGGDDRTRPRLGVVTTSFPSDEDPVSGRFVLALAEALADRGLDVEVLAPEPRAGFLVERPRIRAIGVRYAWPSALRRSFHGAGVPDNVRDPRAWPGLGGFPPALLAAIGARARGWDGAVSHWALPSGLAVALAGRAVPHVAFTHSADVHLLGRLPFGRGLARASLGSARSVAAPSRALTERLGALGIAAETLTIGTAEPAVGAAERGDARAHLGYRPEDLVALVLARHVPVKGIDVAIEAAARAPAVRLVVAGDGPETPRLLGLAAVRAPSVRFVGAVEGVDRRRWLAAADVLVLPSRVLPGGRTEGLPIAALEALAAGIPVVASNVGGLSEVVRDGRNGRLVPPDEPGALAAAMVEVAAPVNRERYARGARAATVPRPDDAAAWVIERLGLTARASSFRRATEG